MACTRQYGLSAADDEKGYIVSGWSRAAEVTEVVENSVAHGVRAMLEPLSEGAGQTLVLVVVAGWIWASVMPSE